MLGFVLFGTVLIGMIVAAAQLLYRTQIDAHHEKALQALSAEEREQLILIEKAQSSKAGSKAASAIASAGGQISKVYASVRKVGMSVRSASSSVGKLKTIYPQFVAVTQAMAIYVSSWTWPAVFTNFTNELSFVFTIRLDVQFPTIPSIAMPVIQIILSGMLLVLAVFLTLHDQKQFYIEALGASHDDVERLTKDYDNLEDEDDDDDSDDDEEKLMKAVGKDKHVGNGLVDSSAHNNKKPDDYDYIDDAMFDNIGKAFFDESSEEEDNAFEGLAQKIRKRAKFQEIVRNALDMDTKEAVSYTHLRAHETPEHLVCRLLLEKKKKY
eukprot:TRINITY_DN13982_c0_g1_i1.p1 TRINITY_DN13982_c0_g1~~TRINITY_DN13982_c0_g1_i1.p1  ORF type:complete len:325 (+),score=90.65 TRINITY_DN13982_c0_g1_i1:455-1429(+)